MHKGGQINNVQMITGIGKCRDVTPTFFGGGGGGCEPRIR